MPLTRMLLLGALLAAGWGCTCTGAPDPVCSDPVRGQPFGCMVPLSGGKFLMGAQAADPAARGYDPAAQEDEGPPHEVELPPFAIHYNEVMVWQYEACIAAGGCRAAEVAQEGHFFNLGKPAEQRRSEHPINGVSWQGAADYCRWIGGALPTEAQWELAARGPRGNRYPWGDADPRPELAVYGSLRRDVGTTLDPHSIGQATYSRQFHMAGNVWEWTADWYDAGYYARSPRQSPSGPDSGTLRVIRGGGWADLEPTDLRSAYRAAMPPQTRAADIGFRCARPLPPS